MAPTKVRKIAVLSGKRGGYGAMRPMMREICRDADNKLQLIVTDQHLDEKFGRTETEVESEFEISGRIPMDQKGDMNSERVTALGVCLVGMAKTLDKLEPDILVLFGDRGESLVGAVAAINMGIPVAHIQGGDISGNVDDLMRNAITKLAHLHFASNCRSVRRLTALGEDTNCIFNVGDCHVDSIVNGEYTNERDVREKFDIQSDQKLSIVLQHPETISGRDSYSDMKATIKSVTSVFDKTLIIYPCSDQGHNGIIRAIDEYAEDKSIITYRNIDAADFLGLLSIASILIGNSSAGIIESPYFRLPVINLGERQSGRLHSENVVHAEFGEKSIFEAIEMVENNTCFSKGLNNLTIHYGSGGAGKKIASILATVDLSKDLLNKSQGVIS